MSEPKNAYPKFKLLLEKAKTEEDVKAAYAKCFDIEYQTSARHDLYTPQVFFEFKYEKNLRTPKTLATVLAQTLYYIRRLKYQDTENPIPPLIGLVDKNTATLTETGLWAAFYDNGKYDWDLAPSNPDPALINDLAATESLRALQTYDMADETQFEHFSDKLLRALAGELPVAFADKKTINEGNFEEVFAYWNKIFGDDVRNGLKTSKYFVCDIQENRTHFISDKNQVVFMFDGEAKVKKIFAKDYQNFWKLYEKVTDPESIRGIIAKIDRLTDETMRRFHGEFFTPLPFAKKGLEYIEKTLGPQWWLRGYRLWDMAAGTGNLEYHLPTEAYPYLYLSTLYKEDVEHLDRLFPGAQCFQYDYLNDDIANVFSENALPFDLTWKLPTKLRLDLQNPGIKWIVMINPPFATAQKAGTARGDSKKDVSNTKVRKFMHEQDLGETSRELFSQFLFRIRREFSDKAAHLGLFSKLKYINSNNDQNLRDKIFQYTYENGFIFSVSNFSGTTGSFPVGFLVWDLKKTEKIENQNISFDVFDSKIEKTGSKIMRSDHRKNFLSKWIKRPAATVKFPPFGSAITIKAANKDRRHRVARGFLASLMCGGNDMQHQNKTCFLSGPYVSAGALSVTPQNFEQAQIVHAVRRLPKADWTTDRDQFMQPNAPLPEEFVTDCTVWNLFSNSNQTVAMRGVEYEGEVYQIANHFFPFLKSEVKLWPISDADINMSLTVDDDRFMALWLQKRQLSVEAQALMESAKEVYAFYSAHLNQLRLGKFKIQSWDVGWWQVRGALEDQNMAAGLFKDLKNKHNALREKLLPEVYSHGFL